MNKHFLAILSRLPSLLSLLLFCFFINVAEAQNQADFFKVPPESLDLTSAPEWAQKMYSEDPCIQEVQRLYDEFYSSNKFEKNIHTQNFKFWYKAISHNLNSDGFIRIPSEVDLQKKYDRIRSQLFESSAKGSIWKNIGPFDTYINDGSLNLRPTQTNISSIAVAPSDSNVLYAGAATGGGIFKSIDHGLNWNLVSLDYPISNADDIKIHPLNPDTVFISNGNKIYKSEDGAATWKLVFTAGGKVEQFYIHRSKPSIVYAASATGLLKSLDGGSTWTNNFNRRCWDIQAHATNPDVIYLSISNQGKKRAEVYKTSNNGSTWILKDSLWYSPADINVASDIGCKLGTTPADTNRVYAALIGSSKMGDDGWIGIYYSLNGGDSWVNPDGIDGGPYVNGNNKNSNWYCAGYSSRYHQGWYNFDMDVSHVDPDRIWVGTIWACESDNRGKNIEYIRGTRSLEMHADIQDIDVVGNEIWYTSDGGINYSKDEMQSVEIRNTGISASTYWGFNQGWNKDIWTGGRYHNGDAVYSESYGAGNTLFLGGAETATGYVNPLENEALHFSDITDKKASNSLMDYSPNIPNFSIYPNEAYTLLNSSEVEYHPNYANVLFLGKDNVFYKSVNNGASFTSLYAFPIGSRVLEFEISRKDNNYIYCIVRLNGRGTIYQSKDGGLSFNATTAIPSNNNSNLDLSMDPNTIDHIWAMCANGANGLKVFNSIDGGQTWINKTRTSLDDHRTLDILYQAGTNNTVYLATDFAVFYWDELKDDWQIYADGLPFNTRALVLRLFYRDGIIRLASDRGIWEAPFAKASLPLAEPMTRDSLSYCSRDTIQLEDHSFLNHKNAKWSWTITPNPAYISSNSVRNPRMVLGAPGAYDVSLTITDSAGQSSSKTIPKMIVLDDQCVPDSLPGKSLLCIGNPDNAYTEDLNLLGVDEFTISAWVKPKGIQPDYTGIVFNSGTSAGLNFRPNNELAYHWPGGTWWWSSGLIVDTNKWSYVALVVKPTGVVLYLNGKTATHLASLDSVDIHQMRIGSYKAWSSRNYSGEIDEVCIWNRALSEEEIRKFRHLTKSGLTNAGNDFVAYYQFNIDDPSVILNRVGNAHAKLNGNASKVLSTVPVAGGTSDLKMISSAGKVVFGSTGFEAEFNSVSSNLTLVASRLNALPDSLPNKHPNTGQYWILNEYGTNGFSGLGDFSFKSSLLNPSGNSTDAELFVRSDNEHLNNWISLCSADNFANAAFNFTQSCGLGGAYQFHLQSSKTGVSIDELSIKELISVYPNPSENKITIELKGEGDIDQLIIIDQQGKTVQFKSLEIADNKYQLFLPKGTGLYFVKLIAKDGSQETLKLIRL